MWRLLSIFLLFSGLSLASVKDSLLSVVNEGTPAQQATVYIKLEREYRNNQPDSALYFITKAYNICVNNSIDTLLLSVYNNLAITYKLKGNYDTTLFFFKKSLRLSVKLKDSLGISSAYNNLGVYYDDTGEQTKALEFFIKSAEIAEIRGDKADIALSYNNIGLIHYKLEDFVKAKNYYEKSLAYKLEINDTNGAALLYNNIGILYYYEDKPQECINYFKKAAEIWQKSDNIRQTAMVFSNIGELYYEIGIYQSSMNYLIESKDLYHKLGDISGEMYALNILGQVYHEWGNDQKAIISFLKAYKMAKQINAKYDMQSITYNLFDLYQNNGQYKLSNEYLTLYTAYKDSLMSVEKDKTMQKLQTQYETEKKEQEIEILNNKNKLNEAEINKQKIFNTALIIGVFLVLIVVALFIRQNRIRKRANTMLMEKNEEIQQQHAEISEQKDEIEAQRDMVHLQKEKIEYIHKHVQQSIDYAQRIQSSTLPREAVLNKNFSDFLVFFKPRDIVSGDFYWWANIENHTVITAADSTGHGVPGAFMSMLGMSFLKEIVVKEYVTHPGVILRKLRKEIINTLKQKGEIGEQKDGMDMSLISFNHETNMLQFAGANNPIYIITQRELSSLKSLEGLNQSSPYQLYEIKPDKMPIAIYDKMDRFTTHEIQLEKGDQIYMFSDGYPDQFGGPKGKKFKYKPFKKLLLKNAHLSMKEQKEILDQTLFNWMKNEEQVDDIVVVGIKI